MNKQKLKEILLEELQWSEEGLKIAIDTDFPDIQDYHIGAIDALERVINKLEKLEE